MSRKSLIITGIVVALLFGAWLFSASSNDKPTSTKPETVNSLQDAHGLAVDRKDSSKVYIATHTGLLVLKNDGEMQRVSEAEDDYMGFSAHPTDAGTFYTSGHPHHGGNLGFQKSTDGGKTWQKISDGAGGPVDFHAMTVGQADPSLVYGTYRGQLQRSTDEGKTWEVLKSAPGSIIALATSTTIKDTVYAGTTDGLYVSQNRGDEWSKVESINGAIATLAVNPKNGQELVAYTQAQGMTRSADGGATWGKLGGYTGSMVMHLAYDPQNPTTMYLVNQDLEIHKSNDGGETWKKIR